MSLLMMSFKTFTLNLLCFGWNKEYTTGCNMQCLWKKLKIFSGFWQEVTVLKLSVKHQCILQLQCVFLRSGMTILDIFHFRTFVNVKAHTRLH